MNPTRFFRTALLACTTMALTALFTPVRATEGMWIPALLQAVEGDMQDMGLKLSAEDIYSINRSSLKDAIVQFGGGCTASLISDQGLLLTNHHCGYGQIQSHSSLERDILKDGFWAMSLEEELTNPGLTAMFIVRIEDVTDSVQAARQEGAEAEKAMRERLAARAIEGTDHDAVVRDFLYGNQQFLIVTRTYTDVRLVGAPPSAIGKYGGDTDNWVWPRHTGDFSLFRIYSGPDGAPAEPSAENIPLTPGHHLPVSMHGVEPGDFTMVFGFPGRTERYIPAAQVDHLIEELNPTRIGMRTASLDVINAAMRADDATRIAYAAKQSRIANAWKSGSARTRDSLISGPFRRRNRVSWRLPARSIAKAWRSTAPWSGTCRRGSKPCGLIWRPARSSSSGSTTAPSCCAGRWGERHPHLGRRQERVRQCLFGPCAEVLAEAEAFYATMMATSTRSRGGIPALHGRDARRVAPAVATEAWAASGAGRAVADEVYDATLLDEGEAFMALLRAGDRKALKKMADDPVLRWASETSDSYWVQVRGEYGRLMGEMEADMGRYLRGLSEVYPDQTFWPDANSTLRLTYGRMEGSEPRDAVTYKPYTTARGVLDKYLPGDAEFDLPMDLVEKLEMKEYGRYADADGQLRIASSDPTTPREATRGPRRSTPRET